MALERQVTGMAAGLRKAESTLTIRARAGGSYAGDKSTNGAICVDPHAGESVIQRPRKPNQRFLIVVII